MKKQICSIICAMLLCTVLSSCDFNISDLKNLIGHEHKFGEWEVTTEVTCLRDGKKTRTCECGETETEVIKTAGHTESEWVITEESTCSVAGKQKKHCTVCLRPLEEEDAPLAEHDWVEVLTSEPKCSVGGYTLRECSVCQDQTTTNHVAALGHDCSEYTDYNFDATVSKNGTVSGICKRCNNTVKKELEGSSALLASAFEGKKISILGDSISTYYGVSNGAAADTTNSTIRDGVLYYDETHAKALGVDREDTWWQRTADSLGADILVNNSWSGSYILKTSTNTRPTPGAYLDRCVNLHDNTGSDAGTAPDIILVYLGTNDYPSNSAHGTASSVNYDALGDKLGDDYVPSTVAEAYAIMLYKMKAAYPNAEIYCLNVLENPSSTSTLTTFNNMIAGVAEEMGCKYVDICANSNIKKGDYYTNYVPEDDGDDTKNSLHPNALGMYSIANCVLDVIARESKYAPDFESLID